MKHWILGRTKSTNIQFFRYLFVGGSSAVVHLLIFTLLMEYLGFGYLKANMVAFVGGLSWNYGFGLLWIFDSKHRRTWEFLMVFSIALAGLFWNQLLLYVFVEYGGLLPLIANIVAIWIVMFWNFGMRKYFVFH